MRFALTFILLGLLLTGCSSPDTKISQRLLGTWTRPAGISPVASDGGFISWEPDPSGSMTILSDGRFSSYWGSGKNDSFRGKWVVKGGMLIMIFTDEDGSVIPAISGHKRKVIRVDEHQLVYDNAKGVRITLCR
jgi:hypothetical protein